MTGIQNIGMIMSKILQTEEMALKARLSLMAAYFTDTYGKCKNHWE